MSETYYKGIRPDGTDFHSGTVQWAPEKTKARKGRLVKHPTSKVAERGNFATFLSVSTDPTNLPGSSWPMRLLEVEAVGDALRVDACKRGATAFRVVGEVDPALHFGPMGVHVVALIDRARLLSYDEGRALDAARGAALDAAWGAAWGAARGAAWGAARGAARGAAWDAAWDAAWGAAWGAAWDAAWDAARGAAWGAVVRDLVGQGRFTQEHYDTLTGLWRTVIGPLHPEDEVL